jgi:hypothetical protein
MQRNPQADRAACRFLMLAMFIDVAKIGKNPETAKRFREKERRSLSG